ncbi:MAG: hypothetical protein KAS12_05580 [Candidatus Aenigmarchaeota archaeon]|nr:hypothetical protein [Candidatus Aenigmarchaeota archaeon]
MSFEKQSITKEKYKLKAETEKTFELLQRELITPLFRGGEMLKTLVNLIDIIYSRKDKSINYDTILSDDASGRLVSLFVKKVIDKERKANQKKSINTYFIASGRYLTSQHKRTLKEFIKSKKAKLGKTLLVTEYISSGRGMASLIKILKEVGVNFDLITLSVKNNPKYYKFVSLDLFRKLKDNGYASIGTVGLRLWNKYMYSGVIKDLTKDSPHPVVSDVRDSRRIKAVREDINLLVEKLSKLKGH